jgi:hypothetical protein
MPKSYIEMMRQEASRYLDEAQDALRRGEDEAASAAMMQARGAMENLFFFKSAGRAPMDVMEVARWKHDQVRALMSAGSDR